MSSSSEPPPDELQNALRAWRRALQILFNLLPFAVALHLHAQRTVAVTFDDVPSITASEDSLPVQERMTRRLVAAVVREHVPAIGFVNGDKLEEGSPLLGIWTSAGLELGNHTYSHSDLDVVGVASFEEDILRNEVTGSWFRHPYLNTGKTLADRDAVNAFLASHGYRVAPVTIDSSDWIYAGAYHRAYLLRPMLRTSYIRYMRARFAWAEAKSREVFGREIPQVLLLHAGALNADAFSSLVSMIRARGYTFVSLEAAVADPAYLSPDTWTGGGVGWLTRWGVARGLPESTFTADPPVPGWVRWWGRGEG